MFHIVTGPFQPVLESSLVAEVQKLKKSDPLAPIAIVVPSEILRRRLQWLLCVERGLALFDVHFLTFHQLALRLYEEEAQDSSCGDSAPFQLVSDMTLRQLLWGVLGRGLPGLQPLSPLRQSPGSCAALWSTLRDLKEAMIDPQAVFQGLEEGVFEEESQDSLRPVFTVYAEMLKTPRRLKIGNADDLAALVIPKVSDSGFLSRLNRVCYYGFYDLTQVQLSLFEAVTQVSDVVVYSPLIDDPAFAFSQRFLDRHLSSGRVDTIAKPSPTVRPDRSSVQVMNAVGAEEELTLVCKEILNLIELHGYAFDEVCVVARSLEPYRAFLLRMFSHHKIPFTSSALRPLIHEPVMKLLIQLSSLHVRGFASNDMLDVLRSPFFRIERDGIGQGLAKPELWQEVVQVMGISRGAENWVRLHTLARTRVEEIDNSLNDGSLTSFRDHWDSIQFFSQLVQELIDDYRALPAQGRIGELTDAFLQFIHKHVVLPGGSQYERGHGRDSSHEGSLAEAVQNMVDQLKQFDHLEETMTWKEWVNVISQVAEECSIPIEPGPHRGVHVLDVMAARGLPFRAVFILGLNEKVFPRYIQEDAFLRDGCRRVLSETLGYKIDEKLSGHDEERLLFALLQQAAQDRLYVSYQRADEDGRPLAPSLFIRELKGHGGVVLKDQEWSLARKFSDRLVHPLFRDSLLTQKEFVFKHIVKGVEPTSLLEHVGQDPLIFQQGLKALVNLERDSQELGPFDGMLGPIDEYWQSMVSKGISPTLLERYAQCPFRYFASDLLGVQMIRNQKVDVLPPSVIGSLCHAVLHNVYVRLIKENWPDRQSFFPSLPVLIESEVEEVFTAYAAQYPTGYWVVWQLLKGMVLMLVSTEVEASRDEFLASGFRPVAVEVNAEGLLQLSGVEGGSLKIVGRLDRVDVRAASKGFRIIDYKYKLGSQMKSHERDLLAASIRGLALQPPLYALMSKYRVRDDDGHSQWSFQPERIEFVYLAPNREPQVERSRFDSRSLNTSAGQQLRDTLTTLIKGIHAGGHFISPGDYCEHCPVSTTCRRFHRPTWRRAYRSEQGKQLRQIRKVEIARD